MVVLVNGSLEVFTTGAEADAVLVSRRVLVLQLWCKTQSGPEIIGRPVPRTAVLVTVRVDVKLLVGIEIDAPVLVLQS